MCQAVAGTEREPGRFPASQNLVEDRDSEDKHMMYIEEKSVEGVLPYVSPSGKVCLKRPEARSSVKSESGPW